MKKEFGLNSKEVDEVLDNVFTYLNKIDIKPYIKKFNDKPIDDLMKALEIDFPYKDKYVESLFDAVAEDEFIGYLRKRYKNIYTQESTITYLYIKNR